MEQRTDEWYQARLGKVTASRIADIISTTKTGGYSTSRKNYMAELICERLTNTKADGYTNSAMQRGIDLEPVARSIYEIRMGITVIETGFVNHPTIQMSGASPDGLVEKAGLVEIKCPNPATHLETFLSEQAPSKYIPQMQWQMACTEREYCDFVSYSEVFPENLQIFIYKVKRNDEYIKMLETEVIKFLDELEETLIKIKE